MTRASRLLDLLKEIKSRETKTLLLTWQEIFEVTSIIEVYERLLLVKKEIDSFEDELKQLKLDSNPDNQNILKTLNFILNFPSLNGSINNQILIKNENIEKVYVSLNLIQTMIDAGYFKLENEENIPSDKFEAFKETIRESINEIEESDIPNEDKIMFLSIFYELNKGISLYKINGISGFMDILSNNICKIYMLEKIIEKDKTKNYTKFKNSINKAVNEVWFWIEIYKKLDKTNLLVSNAYTYIKEKVSEITKDNIEDADIEES
jgi:DNA-binding transcriptional regulator YhcF (GntR family)